MMGAGVQCLGNCKVKVCDWDLLDDQGYCGWPLHPNRRRIPHNIIRDASKSPKVPLIRASSEKARPHSHPFSQYALGGGQRTSISEIGRGKGAFSRN